jgi:hypothetical protein
MTDRHTDAISALALALALPLPFLYFLAAWFAG